MLAERVRANQDSRPRAPALRISDPAAIPEAHPRHQFGSQVLSLAPSGWGQEPTSRRLNPLGLIAHSLKHRIGGRLRQPLARWGLLTPDYLHSSFLSTNDTSEL